MVRAQGVRKIALFLAAFAMLITSVADAPRPSFAQSKDLNALNAQLLKLYQARQYEDATKLATQILTLTEERFGPEHPEVAQVLNDLGVLRKVQGRYAEAERLFKRSLAIREKALGSLHRDVAQSIDNLAGLHWLQDRYEDAEPLFERALAIREKTLGAMDRETAHSLTNLATLYRVQNRLPEAEPLYRRGVAILEKRLGKGHQDVGKALTNLASLYQQQGRMAEAEQYYGRALAIEEKAQHPSAALVLDSLATLYGETGRYTEAEALAKRALAIREKIDGRGSPNVSISLHSLAMLAAKQRDWERSVDYFRQSTNAIIRRMERSPTNLGEALSSTGKSPTEVWSSYFTGLIKVVYRHASEGRMSTGAAGRETFLSAQWAHGSEAAMSLTQMAAREAKGDQRLADLARERQDLVAEWLKRDGAQNAAVAQAANRRDRAAEAANTARLAAIDVRVAEIDRQLVAEFPEYAAFSQPQPLSVEEVQARLRSDECLVLFLDTNEVSSIAGETFIWAVSKTDFRWARSDLGSEALVSKVSTLRKGLEVDNPEKAVAAGQLFDLGLAHDLYQQLLGPVADVIKDKANVIIVSKGSLTSLPFQLLVTDQPARAAPASAPYEAYRQAAWLVRRHAVTVLPAIASLTALRVLAKNGQAAKPMIGFGDPVFDQSQAGQTTKAASRSGARALSNYWQGNQANLEALRAGLVPLPETATELRAVARYLGASEAELRLGLAATETVAKQTDFTPYRVVYFATHGLVAGEVTGLAEPALVLSLPREATDMDDGLLTASEVAQLKLKADWVVLSACNTAAGDKPGAEALSGLARAFFYAGARALLVSHWRVDSEAAAQLITSTFAHLQKQPTIGRAEALRRAMLSMIVDTTNPWHAYPDYWAAFSVIGDG